ncbi:Dihydrolipoyllysine-residue acetyltransferase component of pyruvate dehydrogenase complex [subsurface metagenome]
MIIRIVVPKLSLRAKEAEITRWHKKEGDRVDKEEIIFEIATEKANVEIEAPASGIVAKILHGEGEIVKVGELVGVIATSNEDMNEVETLLQAEKPAHRLESAASEKKESLAEVSPFTQEEIHPKLDFRATPAAKRLCREESIPLEEVYRELKREPITEKEVQEFIKRKKKGRKDQELYEEVKLSPIRKIIAHRVFESYNQKPHIYLFSEIDMSSALKFKETLTSEMPDKDLKVSLTDILIKITSLVLSEFPNFNATLSKVDHGELFLKKFKNINIGIAVVTERGLMVPVIKGVNKKDIVSVARETKVLVTRAKENRLSEEDITGSTFTLTNLGMYGVHSFIPIINPPEVAILALGAITKKPFVANGQLAEKPVMSICLGMDHRALDGADGGKFLEKFKQVIEDPSMFPIR